MDYQQLLEVYFGENQNIKEMQNCITELRKIVRKNNNKFIALNTNKYVQKFNRLAEKEWGFKSFGLSITNSFVIDAYNLMQKYSDSKPDFSDLESAQKNPVSKAWNKYLQDSSICTITTNQN